MHFTLWGNGSLWPFLAGNASTLGQAAVRHHGHSHPTWNFTFISMGEQVNNVAMLRQVNHMATVRIPAKKYPFGVYMV